MPDGRRCELLPPAGNHDQLRNHPLGKRHFRGHTGEGDGVTAGVDIGRKDVLKLSQVFIS
ncbi:Uncharacterised protein [Mycobacteroides abscessus subsp. abscessus]|nr:Uncharacterised protein [Mycobacteroides abscessus subsp. abscessus]